MSRALAVVDEMRDRDGVKRFLAVRRIDWRALEQRVLAAQRTANDGRVVLSQADALLVRSAIAYRAERTADVLEARVPEDDGCEVQSTVVQPAQAGTEA